MHHNAVGVWRPTGSSSYISFRLVECSPGQHSPGASLQEDHSLSLALQLLPSPVTPEMGLKHDGCPALNAVLCVELTGPDLRLQPGKAMLDLEIDRSSSSQILLF